jgi:membrane protein implicated in regulation of membrane protease activity
MKSCGRRRRKLKAGMTDLLWFIAELFVRLVLFFVGAAAGLVALAITAIVALVLLAWRGRRRRHKDDG